jgi:predicted dehydrogenase
MAGNQRTVRIGIIGAGGIVRQRHLPGLAAIDGVTVGAVANRTRESGEKVAKDFGIPDVHTDWRELVGRDDLDAVLIGTWPYMHKQLSIAALEAGKHVFCQARMAMDLDEARAMLAAADANPQLVNMICPPPHRMPWEPYIRRVLGSGELGELREARLVSINGSNLGPLSWREQIEYSGRQFLAAGIWAETLNAWLGQYETLAAELATPIATKPGPDGEPYRIDIPQVAAIHGVLDSGVFISEHHSGVNPHDPQDRLEIIGSDGALRIDAMQQVARAKGDGAFEPVEVSEELQRPWQVEADFINAVRRAMDGAPPQDRPVSPDFAEGLAYMRKIEAVHVAALQGQAQPLKRV